MMIDVAVHGETKGVERGWNFKGAADVALGVVERVVGSRDVHGARAFLAVLRRRRDGDGASSGRPRLLVVQDDGGGSRVVKESTQPRRTE